MSDADKPADTPAGADNQREACPPASPIGSPSASYVYPIKSLLSKEIQRSDEAWQATPVMLGSTRRHRSQDGGGVKRPSPVQRSSHSDSESPSDNTFTGAPRSHPSRLVAMSNILAASSSTAQQPSTPGAPSAYYSGEDEPQGGFGRPGSSTGDPMLSTLSQIAGDANLFSPNRRQLPTSKSSSPDYYTATTSSQKSEEDQGYFAGVMSSAGNRLQNEDLSNISQSGIVHLGPLQARTMYRQDPGLRSSVSAANVPLPASGTPSAEISMSEETHTARPEGADVESSPKDSMSSEEPLVVAHRYEHIETEEGHHMILGREGQLSSCEDEPIRTPGAVQGFGVIIVVEEDFETGSLTVRQVSENSYDILRLSPKYLFALECLTDTLPEAQADILCDNIEVLESTASEQGESPEDVPQVFLLSGWGEPGTAKRRDPDAGPDRRASWTCWCAAHRPQGVTNSEGSSDTSSLIILEFELERDTLNPLYPPVSEAEYGSDFRSGTSSPQSSMADGSVGSGSGGGYSTAGSNDTRTSGPLMGSGLSSSSSLSSQQTLLSGSGASPSEVAPGSLSNASLSGSTAADPSSRATSLSPFDNRNSLYAPFTLPGDQGWTPNSAHIIESTTNRAKPLQALERLRRMNRGTTGTDSPASGSDSPARRMRRRARNDPASAPQSKNGVGMMDVFAVMAQINEQLGEAGDLEAFLKIVVGVIKDLTQFHRVLIYQFDELWNGQVVAELVDWHQTHDLYMGLHFPASDIPAQARELYAINKVRILYNREQPVARILVRAAKDLEHPLNMTHCYLRAMSPIHIKYLHNMGVRASMSVSIMAFGALWGLIACHSYGDQGMRVSFPVRQMLRLLSQAISRNIERLSYAQRLHTRKLINTMTTDQHPNGYIVSNADDLLGLFDADYGMLVIGQGAKLLGPNEHGQEVLVVAEYLRVKQFSTMQVSQAVTFDYPDLKLDTGLEVIAGLLYVPLSSGGKDFIAFLRKGQPREVHWAGRPDKGTTGSAKLEPRASFKVWSQIIAGRSRQWTDEQLETAGVLALVYGKFIEVWRQKETALQTTKLTNILLSNASHEVRTPLNHIINYLEMALNGHLDGETRDNLSRSHAASKSLLFTINDLLDLTRLESGHETSFNEPFDLRVAIEEATILYRNEANRRSLDFKVDLAGSPRTVVGDAKKIRTVVANLTANAVKYTTQGVVTVECHAYEEPEGLRDAQEVAVEIVVADTGCGIPSGKLESIFREFEQVESSEERKGAEGLGLGLAVVARIVEQLGGQLRVDSKLGVGSRFSFLIPFALQDGASEQRSSPTSSLYSAVRSGTASGSAGSYSTGSEVDNFVEALSASHLSSTDSPLRSTPSGEKAPNRIAMPTPRQVVQAHDGMLEVTDSATPLRGLKMDDVRLDAKISASRKPSSTNMHSPQPPPSVPTGSRPRARDYIDAKPQTLRVLIVEDDEINRAILGKRLRVSGHDVVYTCDGQEGVNKIKEDREFDCILMDVQMPILNGFEATERIREYEKENPVDSDSEMGGRLSLRFNGRIPIFAVSASLQENQYNAMCGYGLDGWFLKPIDFKRMSHVLKGINDPSERVQHLYTPGSDWERGGWFMKPKSTDPGKGADG